MFCYCNMKNADLEKALPFDSAFLFPSRSLAAITEDMEAKCQRPQVNVPH